MGETAVALAELLETEGEIDSPTSYLLGQLAAELVTSDASTVELSHLIATTQNAESSSSDGSSAGEHGRQLLFRFLLGLLQGVLVERRAAVSKGTGSPLTVRQRALNLLALAPQNPSSVSAKIGCSFATASRALSRLREQGLVDYVPSSDEADGRYRMCELTEIGEKHLDDRFLGQVKETDEESPEVSDESYDYRDAVVSLTGAVADLNKHDPALAAKLYPALEALKEQVADTDLRAAALGELSVLARSKPDLVTADQSRRWLDELVALATHGSPLTAARAHYERARWTMRYRNSNDLEIEMDLEAAQKYAAEAGGPDGADRTAWCLYQRSSRALWRRDWAQAISLADAASSAFTKLDDHHGWLASRLVSARARFAHGDVSTSHDELVRVVEAAKCGGYKRQLADGLFWLGQAKILNDDPVASATIMEAANNYDALGDRDWRAVAKASAETAIFMAGEMDSAAAKSLRKQLAKAQSEIEKSEGAGSSPAHFFKLASIARQIAVLSAFAGDRPQAARAWKRALKDFNQSDSPEGVSVTLASYWLAERRSGAHRDEVPSNDEVREIGRRLNAVPSDKVIEGAREEVDRFVQQSELDSRDYLKRELAYS